MKAQKEKSLFARVPGTTDLPTQSTRINGYTLNGQTVPADKLPQTTYLDQVKAIGAAYFAEMMHTSELTLIVGHSGTSIALSGAQLERLLVVFSSRTTNTEGDDVITAELLRACSATE